MPTSVDTYTVTELTRKIKSLLETNFPIISLRGEISNFRQQASGHMYFSLKDRGASISCVCFRNDASRLKVRLRDGLQILGSGRVAVYEPRGNYQIIFRSIQEDGIGRLQQAFVELKEKLGSEGLFDPGRKQPLPRLARTIGFVTSESGAALQDFISILRRRHWNGRLVVIPARVQGQEAAPEIVRGIQRANQHQLCDLLVIGRGGGSLEDLWPFNEESVARAVAASGIPIISAVGHEIDFTLSDFAADYRAETPSGAAEWITSAFQQYLDKWESARERLGNIAGHALERHRHRLSLKKAYLKNQHPRHRLDQATLRLDEMQGRLGQSLLTALRESHQRLNLASGRFNSLKPEKQLVHCRENLRQLSLRLKNNSHQSTLNRGYAIIRSGKKGHPVISEGEKVMPGNEFQVEMRDGLFDARRRIDK